MEVFDRWLLFFGFLMFLKFSKPISDHDQGKPPIPISHVHIYSMFLFLF